jgi:hypothetical protein
LRNERLNNLLNLFSGEDNFRNSSDFRVVRDAAANSVASNSPARNALLERANQIGFAQFDPFRNRVATEAGVSSRGLNSTNQLLQNNVNNQVSLLNRAGSLAAQGILDHAASRNQMATGLAGMFAGGF